MIAWLGRIVPALVANRPPLGLESYSTLIIQTLDLGLVMPTAFLSGTLLWKQRPWGYLLASIVLVKGFTMLLAAAAMIVNMMRAGVHVSIGETMMFPTLAVLDIGLTITLLRHAVQPNRL